MQSSMEIQEPYKSLSSQQNSKGIFTTLMTNTEVPRLVCATYRSASGLGGKSLWVSFSGRRWTIATWTPSYYLVPVDKDVCGVVVACLKGMDRCSAFPDDLVDACGLVKCTEQEWDNFHAA